jgi:mono/diheme cytochrome c family protein
MRRLWISFALAGLALGQTVCAAPAAPAAINEDAAFEREVRPILARHCAECHSDDLAELDLNLASVAGLLAGSETGAVLVPGKAHESLLLQVLAPNAEPHMPPDGQLADDEIATIARWVNRLDAATPVGKPKVTAADREHWAFRPLVRPALPAVNDNHWAHTSIDRFVLAQIEAKDLSPSAPADKPTLLRRVYFDLIGLPPTPEESQAFLQDEAPDAFEKVVDRLLASPQYGERWGRHWLDLARYADSSGFHSDVDRPEAWRYRDYVIRSFNDDKPYGQFLREQIAGDELDDASLDTWIATGFARTGPTNEDNMGMGIAREQYRLDELDGVVSTTSSVFLGLTLGCARCHDHKFDPLTQADYYRFLGYFNNTENRQLDVASFQPDAPKLSRAGESPNSVPGALVLTSHSVKPRATRIMYRGDVRKPGPEVQPGVPEVLDDFGSHLASGESEDSPRLALANWLADQHNALVWRVMANRIWLHHFGRGLVATPSNFGKLGQRPTHPELLEWLADELRNTGSVKSLHRQIVTSSVYRQSSRTNELGQKVDSENLLLWRMERRRLEAEPLRDAFLATGGNLNLALGGPGVKPRIREELLVASQRNKWPVVKAEGPEHWRRSVYIYVKRQLQLPLMELFDAPTTTHSCERRDESLVPTQALVLLNDEFLHDQAARFADRVRREAGNDPRSLVERALWIALARPPTEKRVADGVAFLESQTKLLTAEGQTSADAERAALADFCHVLLNMSEFIYVD